MENESINATYWSCASNGCPYIQSLANNFSLAEAYSAVSHPSLPNYLALASADTFSSWSTSDCTPSRRCSAGAALNIIDRIEGAGLTWRAYMEDYPSNCGISCSPGNCYLGDVGTGNYRARHDPFVYFSDIVNSSTRCSRIVPANSGGNGYPDDLFIRDLTSTITASNYMWLTPNLIDDMHDSNITTGDNYLSRLVPQILNSEVFMTQKSALFITWDEGSGSFPNDYVTTIWAGPVVKKNHRSIIFYDHYSLLRTIESAWNFSSLTSNDANAPNMAEFFQ